MYSYDAKIHWPQRLLVIIALQKSNQEAAFSGSWNCIHPCSNSVCVCSYLATNCCFDHSRENLDSWGFKVSIALKNTHSTRKESLLRLLYLFSHIQTG